MYVCMYMCICIYVYKCVYVFIQVLAESTGILDDQRGVDILSSSKLLSDEIAKKQLIAEATTQRLDATRAGYAPVALRASTLFFTIADMASVDPMYQYSLQWYAYIYMCICVYVCVYMALWLYAYSTHASRASTFFVRVNPSIHTRPCTHSHSHPPIHTLLFTVSYSHASMHTFPCTPSYSHNTYIHTYIYIGLRLTPFHDRNGQRRSDVPVLAPVVRLWG